MSLVLWPYFNTNIDFLVFEQKSKMCFYEAKQHAGLALQIFAFWVIIL